jgi:hypothetical protein
MSHLTPRETAPRRSRLILLVTCSAVATSVLIGASLWWVLDDPATQGTLARSTGITSYLLLVALVLLGLALSHPAAWRWRRPTAAVRLRLHVSLAASTLVFTLLHVVLWATSVEGGVGWRGALVPLGSSFRTTFVTFGVLGFYAGLAAGVAACWAGHIARRVWWPIHKAALASLVLIWLHVLGGADARRLLVMYVGTAAAVVALAASRYLARDHRAEARVLARTPVAEVALPGVGPTRRQRRAGLSRISLPTEPRSAAPAVPADATRTEERVPWPAGHR